MIRRMGYIVTDTLRARIALVLSDHDPEGAALCEYHYDVADAVIRELGLPPTWGRASFENGSADD